MESRIIIPGQRLDAASFFESASPPARWARLAEPAHHSADVDQPRRGGQNKAQGNALRYGQRPEVRAEMANNSNNEGNPMTPNFQKLTALLSELFQMDRADLDFGIYRIMNQKRDEVRRFLDHELLPQVREAFTEYIQRQSDTVSVDAAALEEEVFSHLYTFFRRYYKDGDFLSLRRYKEGAYAIPYEGEEVKLHWANADQYYIKSSENFRDYLFTLPDRRRVQFKLVDADTERDNNRAQQGGERRFILCEDIPWLEHEDEGEAVLILRFEYRPDEQKRKQADLNADAARRLLNAPELRAWIGGLGQNRGTEANPSRTLLEKHLTDYTAKNSFDYFIHKDLGGFLRRELDFFIKNEIMHLDDIENDSVPRVEQYLAKIKALRRIAHKIILFLEQLENFQKKLWLKKKFVVETNWCVTLDRVPEELYTAVCANDAQRQEWARLYALEEEPTPETSMQEEQASLFAMAETSAAYGECMTPAFLKANPYLMLDTKFFDREFTDKLLASMDDVDAQCDGVLLHAENFGALQLLQERYREQVKCVYIDPPYNTGGDGFAYKDSYQHSSWMSMFADRTTQAKRLMKDESAFFCSIDDVEQSCAKLCCSGIFGSDNFVTTIIWQKRYAPAGDSKWFSEDHDYITCFSKNKSLWFPVKLQRCNENNTQYRNPDNDPRGLWMSDNYKCNKTADQRPNLYYPISNPYTNREIWPNKNAVWRYNREQHERNVKDNKVWWGINGTNSTPRFKRFLSDVGGVVPKTIWNYTEVGHNQDGIRQLRSLLPDTSFSSPKTVNLISRIFHIAGDGTILDYFAGSGTTAHAVINLNREDGGSRKYILVEVGEYFHTVLKPRIQKVVYSDSWKDGKPVSRQGSSHMFKYMRLESYEDAQNNLQLSRSPDQERALQTALPPFREDYMLGYMLDVESEGSASLLNIDSFQDPFAYQMRIATGSAGETRAVNVDLVETFNYLIGLSVQTMDSIRGFRVLSGTAPRGERVLVIWRNTREQNNADLDEFFRKQGYNTRDQEFDVIYVNGDNNLENLRREDQTWKVRLIEEDFKRLMFDVEDV